MGKGIGQGSGMMNLTLDQAGKTFDHKEKMHTDTAGLRAQMMVKHAELAEEVLARSHRHPGQVEGVERPERPDPGEDDGLPVGSQEDRPRLPYGQGPRFWISPASRQVRLLAYYSRGVSEAPVRRSFEACDLHHTVLGIPISLLSPQLRILSLDFGLVGRVAQIKRRPPEWR